ncbi:hypothetical protein [Acidovorax kalamii]|uniref:hypothetical protein n=1 Tax=Acidovorax kalamii TaxID=2004485 RepID=UPI00209076E7|nr:hypothetical protein [Acidovorax kalamii]MCO5357146.1 hypothetical protein [Acidovorax kalamii]
MKKNSEIALLAGASYESSRHENNKIPVPEGWQALVLPSWPSSYGSQKHPGTNIPGRVYWSVPGAGLVFCLHRSFRIPQFD